MSRSYHQFCGLAKALDHVGERWTLLIARDMLLGVRRYSDLLHGLPGITTNLLAKRLKDMEADGLIERVSGNGLSTGYRLTPVGQALEPAIMALARWGGQFLDEPAAGDAVNIGWALLSLKRRYTGHHPMTAELRAGDRTFTLSGRPDYLSVQETVTTNPDLRLGGEPSAFRELFFMDTPAQALIDRGALKVSGDPSAFEHFLANFGLSRPA